MNDIKKRRISDKDWDKVAEHVKNELQKRKTDQFRKWHEAVWKEVDRQVSMKPMQSFDSSGNAVKNDWHNTIELGELARASEIITADVRRLIFPTTRSWFEAHVELPPEIDPTTGQNNYDQKAQEFEDGKLRALMAQQHADFGFKARMELSVKEALHHGSFVAEARQESMMLIQGAGIKNVAAPVWVPHSMWNCYPDPSPSVVGTNMFYNGSMIIEEFIPLHQLKLAANGEGWMPAQIQKIPKQENKNKDVNTKDVRLTKFYGDISISRGDGDILLPNSVVILANDVIVFYAPNSLPFSPILYNGYERLDVRDPYYVSPLIKLSPVHKMASVLANKYLDAVALRTEPPILYDGNDPQFIANGGPIIAPGWKGATKGTAKYTVIEVGDQNFALQGLQMTLDQLRQGTSVDASRAGGGDTADKTATEIRQQSARGEVRVVDFVDKLEFSLKTFLYMQHETNKSQMERYSFYNPEMDAPDFMWMTQQELPPNVHFDIVGARGVLGEEERSQKATAVTAFASGNPLFSGLLKPVEILKEMYQDAGVKNPERWLNVPNDEMAALEEKIKAEYEQAMQEHEQQIMELEKKVAIQNAVNDAKVVEAQAKTQYQAELAQFKAQVQAELDTIKANLKIAETEAKMREPSE